MSQQIFYYIKINPDTRILRKTLVNRSDFVVTAFEFWSED
jgi:hypothetical protein